MDFYNAHYHCINFIFCEYFFRVIFRHIGMFCKGVRKVNEQYWPPYEEEAEVQFEVCGIVDVDIDFVDTDCVQQRSSLLKQFNKEKLYLDHPPLSLSTTKIIWLSQNPRYFRIWTRSASFYFLSLLVQSVETKQKLEIAKGRDKTTLKKTLHLLYLKGDVETSKCRYCIHIDRFIHTCICTCVSVCMCI